MGASGRTAARGVRYELTDARRVRVREILCRLGDGVSVRVKARAIVREWPVAIEMTDALSMLAQFKKRPAGKCAEDTNKERFEQIAAQRPDLYD